MKTPNELNALKEEVETVNKKLAELTDEELALVTGGLKPLGDDEMDEGAFEREKTGKESGTQFMSKKQ